MRSSSFWPPRRTRDRIAAELYQKRNPDVPWLGQPAIAALSDLLRPTDRCLEWGSGTSTAWLCRRVASITSAEHDPAWFERVRSLLDQDGLRTGVVRLLSTDPQEEPSASPYVRLIDEFADGELDVCYVDGEHRAACITAALPKLASGGMLVLDDAHGFLDHETVSPHSRQGLGPLDLDWASFEELVSDWRLLWTSDGFSDTAIWFKP
ncbi:MAG: class I SAM-dependent methyltransferase [Solirubrobacterales bacterium]|nr:class I SAM-dependent methyltransferase [Solirubrobacterales bacterium]